MFFTRVTLMLALSLTACGYSFSGEGREMSAMNHAQDMDDEEMEWTAMDDAAFLSGMIVHHRGALEMAEEVVDSTKDAQVAKWAKDILASQRAEIASMQAILESMKERDPRAERVMQKQMDEMMAMTMSEDPDANFVMMMIPHHAGAIDMSLPALIMTSDARIRQLAREIIVAQTNEIAEFRDWMDAHQEK